RLRGPSPMEEGDVVTKVEKCLRILQLKHPMLRSALRVKTRRETPSQEELCFVFEDQWQSKTVEAPLGLRVVRCDPQESSESVEAKIKLEMIRLMETRMRLDNELAKV